MIKAVCFDMFDTLANARRSVEPTEHSFLGISREEWSRVMWEDSLVRDRGLGRIRSIREMIDRACDALDMPVPEKTREAVTTARCKRFRAAVTGIDPVIVETVREIRSMGYRIGLISNADICDCMYWNESPVHAYFDDSVFSCNVGLLKPDVQIYRLSMNHLGVLPEETLFVGDGGGHELAGAHAAGMSTVCTEYLTRHPDPERQEIHGEADWVIEQFQDLIGILEGDRQKCIR